jgi:putative alpha-1,2-mannosidase
MANPLIFRLLFTGIGCVLLMHCNQNSDLLQPNQAISHTDLFWGTGVYDRNRPITRSNSTTSSTFWEKWSFPKPKQGNLHPGAALPFHLISVSPFGNGYPTGYNPKKFEGFSHFHPSGTGYILWFYNYFLLSPVLNDTVTSFTPMKESAKPGYYHIETAEGLNASASIWDYVSYTSFTFPENHPATIRFNLTHVYKPPKNKKGFPSVITYRFEDNRLFAHVFMDGIPIYLVAEPDQIISSSFTKEIKEWKQNNSNDSLIWEFSGKSNKINLKIAFSLKNFNQALERLNTSTKIEFASNNALESWQNELGRIRIKGLNSNIDTLFYSALYRSLIKPVYAPDDHPFSDSTPYFTDFATWWDSYQTHMPLLSLLYPEMMKHMLEYLPESLSRYNEWKTADLFSAYPVTAFDNQGTALAPIAIADIWKRIGAVEHTESIIPGFEVFFNSKTAQDFGNGVILGPSPVQHVDYAAAFFVGSEIYRELGNIRVADSLELLSKQWQKAYDSNTNLLSGNDFYEAGPWNYSFKPWWNASTFIEFMGGKNALISQLNTFFGFTADSANLFFEGLNNEVDMSVPYWFNELGEPNRTQEIIRAIVANRIGLGRGGIPGNEDSGALSSWIVWNILGLYPKQFSDAYFIGSPLIHNATIYLHNTKITIKVNHNSEKNLYVTKATWNGNLLHKLVLNGSEFRKGGTLELWMSHDAS